MSAAVLLGAGAGTGALLLLMALRPRRRALDRALAALDRPRTTGARDHVPALARRLAAVGAPPERAADLQLIGRSYERHALRKVCGAGALAAIAPGAALLAWLGGVGVTPAFAVLPALSLAAIGYVLPDIELRSVARERRAAFVHALSGYLDVTAVLLAGGAGTETALHAAAGLGSGWPHQRLRAALDRCRLTGQTPWEAFGDLGDRLRITELTQLAASLALAGEHGARVRMTLTERARALRAQQLAEAEARARAATEHMSVPVALLAVAFMLFVGFPAVWVVLGEL